MNPDSLLLLAQVLDQARVIDFVVEHSYLGVFAVLIACGCGLPLPEELPLIGGGYAIYKAGLLDPARGGLDDALLMVVVALVGVLIGDLILYSLGRRLGRHPDRIPVIGRALTKERLERARALFQRHGAKAVFFSRFAFGIRGPMFFVSGSLRVPVRTFLVTDGLAASITVPTAVLLAWRFGSELDRAMDAVGRANRGILVGVGVLFLVTVALMLRRARRTAEAALDEAEAPASPDPSEPVD